MDHHLLHAERVGDEAGVLAAGAAEAGQHVAGHVVPARDRDRLDRVRHVGDGDRDQALGRRVRIEPLPVARSTSSSSSSNRCADRLAVERLVAVRAEQAGEMVRLELAEHHVAVGHGQRPAAPVAGRPGHRARRFGPDQKAPAVEPADRAAARRDGVDAHHRRADPDAGDGRVVAALVAPGVVRHVGRGAAHVEADDMVEPGARGGRAMPTMPPAGPDRIASLPWKAAPSISPPFDCMKSGR